MPLPDFSEEERAEVVQAIRAAIDGDRYVLSPRVKRLKSVLAKLDPLQPSAPSRHSYHRGHRGRRAWFING